MNPHMQPEWPEIHPLVCRLRLKGKPARMNPVHMKSQNQNKKYTSIVTHPHAPQPVYTNMYMPYTEGPKMDWMVNDALYHWFLKWKLKCENILESKFAALPKHQKCKKVIVWSWWLWNRSICILGAIQRRHEPRHNMGEVWRFSANHNPIRCVPNLIYWPVSIKETRVSMNGTMLYRHR